MQKYSDLKKYYHFSSPDAGTMSLNSGEQFAAPPFVRNTVYSPQPREQAAQAGHPSSHGRSSFNILYIVLTIIILGSGLYVRNQALYNENSVFYDLYSVFKGRFGELSLAFMTFPKTRAYEGVSQSHLMNPSLSGTGNSQAPLADSALITSDSLADPSSPASLAANETSPQTVPQTIPQTVPPVQDPSTPNVPVQSATPEGFIPGVAIVTKETTVREQNGTLLTESELIATPTRPGTPLGEQASTASPSTASPSTASPIAPATIPVPNSPNLASHDATPAAALNSVSSVSSEGGSNAAEVTNPRSTALLAPTRLKNVAVYLPVLRENKSSVVLTKHNLAWDEPLNPIGNVFEKIIKDIVAMNYGAQGGLDFFPERIQVNRVWMENKTLIIDVNRAFEYSRYGRKALEVRLQLLLWGALSLNNQISEMTAAIEKPISFVSILIDGKRITKLGGDGWVLNPFYSIKDLKTNISFLER